MGAFLASSKPSLHWTLYTPESVIVFQSTPEVIVLLEF